MAEHTESEGPDAQAIRERRARDRAAGASPLVRILGLSSGGEGVGRLEDGRVVFVEGAVPGDLVDPCDWTEARRMVRARIGRLVESSPDRVEPSCIHFGVCGGCLWQHIAYPAQLSAKQRIVRDALERIGRLTFDRDFQVPIEASPRPYAYRARARLVEQEGRVGFRRRGSREVEPIEHCPVLVPAAEARRRAIAESVALGSTGMGKNAPQDASIGRGRRQVEWALLAGMDGSVVSGRISERGSGEGERLNLSVLGESLQASRDSFVQGNALLWDALAAEVRAQSLAGFDASTEVPRATRFVELYAGIGFLTLPLARAGLSGVAIERDRSAIRDLRLNLRRAGLADRVEVLGGRVERRGDLSVRLARADLLLVDPPRSGIEESVRKTIARAGPARIVYVSCDPATLARDLRFLGEEGSYRLRSIRGFDLFPQTPHVETVSRLERDRSPHEDDDRA
jgi:23S rRNA (uracil1939-C5)-methyltransferase